MSLHLIVSYNPITTHTSLKVSDGLTWQCYISDAVDIGSRLYRTLIWSSLTVREPTASNYDETSYSAQIPYAQNGWEASRKRASASPALVGGLDHAHSYQVRNLTSRHTASNSAAAQPFEYRACNWSDKCLLYIILYYEPFWTYMPSFVYETRWVDY